MTRSEKLLENAKDSTTTLPKEWLLCGTCNISLERYTLHHTAPAFKRTKCGYERPLRDSRG